MIVGLCELMVAIPGASNLKQKRSAMRKVIERTRSKFAISIAETDQQDKWQRGTIGFAIAGNDHAYVQSLMDRVITHIEGLYVVMVVDAHQSVTTFSPTMDERTGFRFD